MTLCAAQCKLQKFLHIIYKVCQILFEYVHMFSPQNENRSAAEQARANTPRKLTINYCAAVAVETLLIIYIYNNLLPHTNGLRRYGSAASLWNIFNVHYFHNRNKIILKIKNICLLVIIFLYGLKKYLKKIYARFTSDALAPLQSKSYSNSISICLRQCTLACRTPTRAYLHVLHLFTRAAHICKCIIPLYYKSIAS